MCPPKVSSSRAVAKADHLQVEVEQEANPGLLSENQGTSGKLGLAGTIALFVADVVGTGILGLPGEVHELGFSLGISFLAAQLPINYYIGSRLNAAAASVDGDKPSDKTRNIVDLAAAVYGRSSIVAHATRAAYYANLFLVLGNYLVVMSHAVEASLSSGHKLCPYEST